MEWDLGVGVEKAKKRSNEKVANRMEKHQLKRRKDRERTSKNNEEELPITLKSSTPLLRLSLFCPRGTWRDV